MILHSFQQVLVDKISAGGFKQSELAIFSTGRQTGKSLFKEYYYDWFAKTYSKKHWPYQYTVARDKITEAERWCWERFKGRYWNNNHNKFVFKRGKDAALFSLRWA